MVEKPENLDSPKSPRPKKIGRGLKTVAVEIDLTVLPPDLVAAFIEKQKPFRHKPASNRQNSKARKKTWKVQKAERSATRPRKPGVYDKDLGRGELILGLAREWVTRWELRIQSGLYSGAVRQVVNRLWLSGQLLKRKNPAAAENRYRVRGPESCLFQYKAAKLEQGGKPDSDKA